MKRRNSGSTKIIVATTLSVVALVGVSIFSIQSFAANSKDQGLKQSVLYEADDDRAVSAKLMDVSDSDAAESTTESEIVAKVVSNDQAAQPAAELEVVDSKVQASEAEKESATTAAASVQQVSNTTTVEVVDSRVSDQTLERAYDELVVVDNTVTKPEETTEYIEEATEYIEETTAYEEETTTYEEETTAYVEETTAHEEETTTYVEETTTYEEETTTYVEETTTYEEETTTYIEETTAYEEETTTYIEETTTYEEETTTYEEETTSYVEETTTYEEETTPYEEETTEEQNYDEYVSYNAELASQIVSYAYQWVGVTPYIDAVDRWSEEEGCYINSLTEGTDCSGFTHLIYGEFGIYVPTWSDAYQYGYVGTFVSYEQLMPGDIVVYDNGGHVAIYAGGDTIIHCSNPADGTKVSTMWYKNPTAFVRVVY